MLLFAAMQAPAQITPPPVAPVVPPPPIVQPTPPVADWPALPSYPLPRAATDLESATYVRAEVEAGRCPTIAPPQADGAKVIAPVAMLVGAGGTVRRIVPRAIGCPTIEQYTVGYLLSATRSAAATATLPPAPGWYRLTVTYRW